MVNGVIVFSFILMATVDVNEDMVKSKVEIRAAASAEIFLNCMSVQAFAVGDTKPPDRLKRLIISTIIHGPDK